MTQTTDLSTSAKISALDKFSTLVKAYDVRGLVGEQLTEKIVQAFGAAFADEVAVGGGQIIVGHDMRDSSPAFAAAFADGALKRGAQVTHIGLCSTDENYFASGFLNAPAAMFTASHNPASYNGIKFSRAGAQGISLETGLAAIRDRASHYHNTYIPIAEYNGTLTRQDMLHEYAKYLRSLVDLTAIKPLRVVVDAGNGMAGLTVPAVLGKDAGLPELPVTLIPLYFELDGSFPNHEPNPLVPENLRDLRLAVVEHSADIGLAFDGDADRCFVVDESGEPVDPSVLAAIVASREIARAHAIRESGVRVIHNLITSRHLAENIVANGGIPVRTRVGHSFIKEKMRETGAIFGAEHSAHYYFRDFWGADNGLLAAMHLFAELGAQTEPLSRLAAKHKPYSLSGEINREAKNIQNIYARIRQTFTGEAQFDELDGLTVTAQLDSGFWWFNLRASNTEPLVRLNVEADTLNKMHEIRDRVLKLLEPAQP